MGKSNNTSTYCKVTKVDEELGLVFGFAIICKQEKDGEMVDYHDLGSLDEDDGEVYSDHISENEMLRASTKFMANSRLAKEMHDDDTDEASGIVVHSFPLTEEIAKSLDIVTKTTGWLVAMKPDKEMLAKFKSGELTGFSIGGKAKRKKKPAADYVENA